MNKMMWRKNRKLFPVRVRLCLSLTATRIVLGCIKRTDKISLALIRNPQSHIIVIINKILFCFIKQNLPSSSEIAASAIPTVKTFHIRIERIHYSPIQLNRTLENILGSARSVWTLFDTKIKNKIKKRVRGNERAIEEATTNARRVGLIPIPGARAYAHQIRM